MNRLAVLAIGCSALTGCAESVTGAASPAINASESLPFTPTISERINGRNDGTIFEPCTAYSSGELTRLGMVPDSVADAAFSESPNFRGCHWRSPDSTIDFTQIVGDEISLANYKRKQSHRPWQPDRDIGGRTVAVAREEPDACIAVFMSSDAIVATGVGVTTKRSPSPGLTDECDKAIAFATLAAAKAP